MIRKCGFMEYRRKNKYCQGYTPSYIFLEKVKHKMQTIPRICGLKLIFTCCFRIAKMSTTRINASMKNPTMATTRYTLLSWVSSSRGSKNQNKNININIIQRYYTPCILIQHTIIISTDLYH